MTGPDDPGAPAPTLPGLLVQRATEQPRAVALRKKHLGRWKQYSWQDYAARTEAVALALVDLGVQPGDRVAIQSGNRPAWAFADLAAQSIGAVSIGVHPDDPAAGLEAVLAHSEAVVLVAEDEEQLDKALEARARLPVLRRIIVIDPRGVRQLDDPMIMTLASLEALGRASLDEGSDRRWREGISSLDPSQPAALAYTAPGAGAMISHANLVAAGGSFRAALGLRGGDEVLSDLSLSHMAQRVTAVAMALVAPCVVNFGEGGGALANDMREVQPTYVVAPPLVWERVMADVEARMAGAALVKRAMYRFWRRQADGLVAAHMAGRLGVGQRAVYALGWVLLFRPLRAKLGLRRARAAVSLGAPALPASRYFWSIGVRVRECYGPVQSTAVGTLTPDRGFTPGTQGSAMPGVELRIAADGDVLLRGPTVFMGYFRDPGATAATVDEDGWLRTGDVGEVDADGNLVLSERRSDRALIEELYRP